jgi:hypothetical protein
MNIGVVSLLHERKEDDEVYQITSQDVRKIMALMNPRPIDTIVCHENNTIVRAWCEENMSLIQVCPSLSDVTLNSHRLIIMYDDGRLISTVKSIRRFKRRRAFKVGPKWIEHTILPGRRKKSLHDVRDELQHWRVANEDDWPMFTVAYHAYWKYLVSIELGQQHINQ